MPPPEPKEIKDVPKNEEARDKILVPALSGIESLPTPLRGLVSRHLNFQEILGIMYQRPALKDCFHTEVYPRIHIRPLQIEHGPHYSERSDYCLQIRGPNSSGQIAYRIQFYPKKDLPFESVNWSEIEAAVKEEHNELTQQQKIEQYILDKNKENIKKTLLSEIPDSSLCTFFTFMSILYPNQSSSTDEVTFESLRGAKKLILNQEKLLKKCRDNIILAHLILKASDPWMHKRLPYTERFSPNTWKFIVFGVNEKLWYGSIVLYAILAFIIFCASIAVITLQAFHAIDSFGIISPEFERAFLLFGSILFPFILQPLYYVILKFFATLVTGVPNTLQRAVEIYDNLLKLQADIPESTFLPQEKENIKSLLSTKKTNLVQQNGLFSFFNRNTAKVLSVDRALEALENVCSKETLAGFMDKYLNDREVASLHADAPESLGLQVLI